MRNIFGKIYFEDANEFLCKNVPEWQKTDDDNILEVVIKARKCRANSERVSELVLDIIHNLSFYKRLTAFMNKDYELKEALDFDLKFLMIASYYYMQLSKNIKLCNETLFINAFKKGMQIRSKRASVKANNQQSFPLNQFFRDGKQTKMFESVLDIGIVLGIIGSSTSSVNPYIDNGQADKPPDKFRYKKYLQLYKHAYVGTEDIRNLFKKLKKCCDKIHNNEYDYSKNDYDEIANIHKFIENTSKYGYAVLNQYFIERLTNINYIISVYKLKSSSNHFIIPSEVKLILDDWIKFPLLKTRLKVVSNIEKKSVIWDMESQKCISIWLTYIISIALTAFHYLMKECKYSIKKSNMYFENIYCDPKNYSYLDNQDNYLFFIKKDDSLLPVEKVMFNNKRAELQFESFAKQMSKTFDLKTRDLENLPDYINLQRFNQYISSLRDKVMIFPEIVNAIQQIDEKYQINHQNPLTLYDDIMKPVITILE